MFQLTAPGATGPGTAVPNLVVAGIRMEQGRLLNLQSMGVANAQEQQLPRKAATPMSAQVGIQNYKMYKFF